MQSDSLTLYKLMILYMISQVKFPLTYAQISSFILEQEYTHYFNLQASFVELQDAGLIKTETVRNTSLCKLTETGQETLKYFEYQIPTVIKQDIKDYFFNNKFELRETVSNLADYYRTDSGEFMVCCKVLENQQPLVEIHLLVPTDEQAVCICNNWKNNNQEVYSFLMKTMMKSK